MSQVAKHNHLGSLGPFYAYYKTYGRWDMRYEFFTTL